MASQSGGYGDGGGGGAGGGMRRPNFSSMEQPPLLKQLKCILAEYPDGGQIVKELIQNAEDAGATTVKIVYDARPVNQEATSYYSKFFKGPAILLYNDGMFTEQDWKGIKMIYSSVKEDDRLKVGRFGLGFKSVFHITDCPSIFSGNRLLLIDPHKPSYEVNAEFEVDHLSEYKEIDVSEFYNSIEDTFQEITTTGPLQGTMFRFPLRLQESPLSDNLYDERKVLDLFDAFKKEASYILLFLKCISNITLGVKKCDKVFKSVAAVELVNSLQEIQAERNRFKSAIRNIGSDYNGNPIESFSEVHIQTTLYDENEVSNQSTQTWLVVSYFMGSNASEKFKNLIKDKSVGYSPYVGIAAPLGLTGEERCEGHEFCFLPLPKEGRQVTGLPFHVNGFFSLSQNRHHIKWATDEQQENRITDKNILWNQSLAREALPFAYKVLLDNAIQIAKSRNLGAETIASILPFHEHTSPNWMIFVKNLFRHIKDMHFLKVHEQNTWVNVDEACFATFSCLEATGGTEIDEEMKNHVVKSLLLMNQPYVKISTDLFKTLCHFYGEVNDTVPRTVSCLLKKAGPIAYTPLPDAFKFSLIQFLLSENNYELLVDLELIPLACKKWTTFNLADNHKGKLLLSSKVFREMNFPGLEDRFLELPDNLLRHFDRLCKTDQYNVKHQTIEDTVEMVSLLLSKNGFTLTDGSLLSLPWLEKVWSFFRSHVNKICKLPLVPLLRNGTWETPQSVDLIPLNKMIILKSGDEPEDLSDGLCNCLDHLSITVLTSLPLWFPLEETSKYICQPSQLDRLLKKLAKTSNINSVAENFNKNCPNNSRQEFRKFIACFHTDDEKLITLQKNLEIFYESDNLSQPQLVSMVSKSHRMEYVLNLEYPIRYPKSYLLIDNDIETLVKRLGASRCYRGNLVESTVQRAMLDHSEKDKITFMKFFIENFEEFSNIANITQMVRKVTFVKCKGLTDLRSPAELFDPTDPLLQNLLDDCFFPQDTQPAYLNKLKKLGMNELLALKADHVRDVAVYLDDSSLNNPECGAKADAVLLALCRKPQLLQDKCSTGSELKIELSKLHWLNFVKKSSGSFPNCIPWYSSSNRALCQPREAKLFRKWHSIIGAVMPTVQCDKQEVINHFGWNIDPDVTMVVKQLELVKKRYDVNAKTEIVMVVKAAYAFLDRHRHDSITAVNLKELVWVGHAFVSPCKVVVYKTPECIDLNPYFFFIPEEMAQFAELFKALGCYHSQDTDVLLSVLNEVQKEHQSGTVLNPDEDLQIVVRILEKLSNIENIASRSSEIFIPVHTSERGQLVLKPAQECAYTDEDYIRDEEDEGEFTFVHHCISEQMAKVFGIKTIAGHVLADAEGLDMDVEECGQEESLTTRLNTLLREGYKDGLSVPKELVQNADDANASVVKILYDERHNTENMERLLNKGMQECHGPALWFYNDASFTEADFKNIIKLNGATKKNECGKIGRFGLGFCSVYNITDVPCFFSGTSFVYFDPHRTYLRDTLPGASPGMKINLNTAKRKTQLRKYRDQFLPFQGVFGCSILNQEKPFEGTLFRFPLRTDDQADKSKIKKKAYSKSEVSKLLSIFVEKVGDMLLFTQNVKKIEIYHLGPDGTPDDCKLLFSVLKEIQSVNVPGNTCTCANGSGVLKTMSSSNNCRIADVHVITITIDVFDRAKSILPDVKEMHTKYSWLVSWASGQEEAKNHANCTSALPLAAVAIPCIGHDKLQPFPLENIPFGFHASGRLFCFLPLPIESGLSLHLNACFDVTSDRRQLLSDCEDDMKTPSHGWNEALLTDAALCAFLQLLETFLPSSLFAEYYSIWPTAKPKQTWAFVNKFYTYIVVHNVKIFKGIESTNLPFSQVCFIDPILIEDSCIGKYCLALLCKFQPRAGKLIIDLPINILRILEDCHQRTTSDCNVVGQAIVKEQELILTFLNSLHDPFWHIEIEMRNVFLAFSLKSESDTILEIMRTKECIPTKPKGRLQKPGDMVSEESKIADLFLEEDERFLQSNEAFDFDIERKLKRLGMMTDKLPENILLERCTFIKKIATRCSVCGYELSLKILLYLCRPDVQLDLSKDTLQELHNIHFLPVLCRPHDWKLPWFSQQSEVDVLTFSALCDEDKHKENREPLRLEKPPLMHRQRLTNSLCCVGLLVNEKDYKIPWRSEDALKFLGVKDTIPFTTAVRQFVIIISNYNKEDVDAFRPVIYGLYEFFSDHLKCDTSNTSEQSYMKEELQTLSDSSVVLIDSDLVKATDVAFHAQRECRPYLYKLPAVYKSQSLLFQVLGVKQSFSCNDAISVLKRQKEKWHGSPCSDIDTICNLLNVLVESMKNQQYIFQDLKESHKFIIAPDAEKILRPTSELVIDEDDFVTKQKIHILNGEIPPALALIVGVQPKQKKCRANISRGIPFGQKEELVTRLQGLLNAYPCDSGIMKELIQNADDAGATEICFITDFRSHEKDLKYGCLLVNEPSLCVYNNSSFTEKDMDGIHNLGRGSKRGDPTKTGQYGVGFNAVYHLTDLPAFMTVGPDLPEGGSVCIFDPLCNHIDDVSKEEPGIRSEVNGLKSDFPNMLLGFHEEKLLDNGVGTVFRFPLRRTKSQLSSNVFTNEYLKEILEQLKKDMLDVLLFVKNVNCIKIMDITDGSLHEEYAVHLQMTDSDRTQLKKFNNNVREYVSQHKDENIQKIKMPFREVHYKVTVTESGNSLKTWLLVQRCGFQLNLEDGAHSELISAFKSEDIGLLPVGGVAIPLDNYDKMLHGQGTKKVLDKVQTASVDSAIHWTGRAFCFLPLPLQTDLPLHINGHFSLDHEARRELWKGGYREAWNNYLLNYVVIPAWISGIILLQEMYVSQVIKLCDSWTNVNQLMNLYHSSFPAKQTGSSYWTNCVKYFYVTITEHEPNIFPVVRESNSRFTISWFPVKSSISHTSGVFNTIKHVLTRHLMPTDNQRLRFILSDIFKNIGMRLLHTPLSIHETMKSLELLTDVSDTSYVINFLQTFCEENSICKIGPMGKPIEKSNFRRVDNLSRVVRYIHVDKSFSAKLDGLPILLTADGILHQCSVDKPILSSIYYDLLPKSQHQFLHIALVPFIPCGLEQSKTVVLDMTIEKLVELLPHSFDETQFCSWENIPLNWHDESPVSVSWLCKLFQFLISKESRYFAESLYRIIKWSFLPSVHQCDGQPCSMLIPFEKGYSLFAPSMGSRNRKLDDMLKSLSFPYIDNFFSETIRKQTSGMQILDHLQNLCASTEKPGTLLKCLISNRTMWSHKITPSMAKKLVVYFSENLDILKENYGSTLKTDMWQLPLFITHDRRVVSIDDVNRVCVIPNLIPYDGVFEFAETTGLVFLESDHSFEKLYEYLKLHFLTSESFYDDILLPSMAASMHPKHWIKHIEYVRDYCLKTTCTFSSLQISLIKQLQNIPFINSKKANGYFYHDNPVFKCMLSDDQFLPKEYRSDLWIWLLKKIGLVMQVDDNLFEQFARQIESNSNVSNDETTRKSNILVNELLSKISKMSDQLLARIAGIRFVVPFKVETSVSQYCSQYQDGAQLISFRDSTIEENWKLCWTCLPMITETILSRLDSNQTSCLGIKCRITVEQAATHCNKVCSKFKGLLDSDKDNEQLENFVRIQMDEFYIYFNNQLLIEKHIPNEMRLMPLVYVPQVREMIRPDQTVVELLETDEIQPYIYRVPMHYNRYADLFIHLGGQKYLTCVKLATVLQEVHNRHQDNPVIGSDWGVVMKTLQLLFHKLVTTNNKTDKQAEELKKLFLPNIDKVMCESKKIVINNAPSIRQRLKKKSKLNWFYGFSGLEICHLSESSGMKKLPKMIQPSFLRDLVTEIVCLENVQVVEQSQLSMQLHDFLHSDELFEGLIRLIHHKEQVVQTVNENVRKSLRNIQCVEVTEIPTVLQIEGSNIEGSEKNKTCHIQEDCLCTKFYFQVEDALDRHCLLTLNKQEGGLYDLLLKVIDQPESRWLFYILDCIYTRHKIGHILDDSGIDPYNLSQSNACTDYPAPGTYVEETMLPFLVLDLRPFQCHEYKYVAMEIQGCSTGEEKTYKYACILDKIGSAESDNEYNMGQRYRVNCGGEDPVSVGISYLYRFVRPSREENVKEKFGNEPQNEEEFKNCCQQVRRKFLKAWELPNLERDRIIERLMDHWCDGKNKGNDFAKRAMNYLCEIAMQKERSEQVSEVDINTGQVAPDTQYSFIHKLRGSVEGRSRTRIIRFRASFRNYKTYIHKSAAEAVRPDIGEARRWLRQATHDYQAASQDVDNMRVVPAHNWTCYKCHQACEKAIKAVLYSVNANKVPNSATSHNLVNLARNLSEDLQEQAQLIMSRLGGQSQLRYPDAVCRDRIPSDMYDMEAAKFAIEHTKMILKLAGEAVDST